MISFFLDQIQTTQATQTSHSIFPVKELVLPRLWFLEAAAGAGWWGWSQAAVKH